MSEDATPREPLKGDAGGGPRPARRHPGYPFLVIVSVLTLAADLGSKAWVMARLGPHRPFSERKIQVIKDHLNLIFAQNPGGAWGLLQDERESLRIPFFVAISIAAVVFIVSLYRKTEPTQWTLKWGLPLVLGGALGNLVDRIRYGHVIDFIQVHVTKTFTWPTFNVADIAIVVGVGLMFIDMFLTRKPKAAASSQASAAPASAEAQPEGRGDAPLETPAERKASADET